jgi:hypothetical protein
MRRPLILKHKSNEYLFRTNKNEAVNWYLLLFIFVTGIWKRTGALEEKSSISRENCFTRDRNLDYS